MRAGVGEELSEELGRSAGASVDHEITFEGACNQDRQVTEVFAGVSSDELDSLESHSGPCPERLHRNIRGDLGGQRR